MTTDGMIRGALFCVESELEDVEAKTKAFRRFERTVSETTPLDRRAIADSTAATGGALVIEWGGEADRCRRLRERFAGTVYPHSLDDVDSEGSVIATIREELGEEAALALSSGGRRFTPGVKRGILTSIKNRHRELRTLKGSLKRERESLQEVDVALGSMVESIETFGDRRLLQFGFEELREHHERLNNYRTRCDRLAVERQKLLGSLTGREAKTGIAHRTLVEYLYDSPAHPVLDAIVQLDRGCAAGQRALRDHLCRRV